MPAPPATNPREQRSQVTPSTPSGVNRRSATNAPTSPTRVSRTRIAVYVLTFAYWKSRPRAGRPRNSAARSGHSVSSVADQGMSMPLVIVSRCRRVTSPVPEPNAVPGRAAAIASTTGASTSTRPSSAAMPTARTATPFAIECTSRRTSGVQWCSAVSSPIRTCRPWARKPVRSAWATRVSRTAVGGVHGGHHRGPAAAARVRVRGAGARTRRRSTTSTSPRPRRRGGPRGRRRARSASGRRRSCRGRGPLGRTADRRRRGDGGVCRVRVRVRGACRQEDVPSARSVTK